MKKFQEFKKCYRKYEIYKFLLIFLSVFLLASSISGVTGNRLFLFFPILTFYFLIRIFIKKDSFYAAQLEKLIGNFDGKILTALLYRKSDNPLEKSYSEYILKKVEEIDVKNIFKKDFIREKKVFIFSFTFFTLSLLLFPNGFVRIIFSIPEPKEKIIYTPPPEYHYTTQNFVYSARIIGSPVKKAEIIYIFKRKEKKEKVNVSDNRIVFVYKPKPGTLRFKLKTKNDETPFLSTVFLEPPRIEEIKVFYNKKEMEIPFIRIKENKELLFKIKLSQKVDSEKVTIEKEKIKFKNVKDFEFKIKLRESTQLKFVHFIKNDSFRDPQIIYVNVTKELKPFVKIISPDFNVNIPDEMKIPFILYASDDVGLDKAYVYIEKEGKIIFEKVVKKFQNIKSDTFSYVVDFDPLNPSPGENFYVFFRVFDDDEIKKYSDTRKILVHMPTFEELYEQVKKESEKLKEELEPVKSEAKDIIEDLKKLREKISENISRKDLRKETKELEKSLEEITKKLEEVDKRIKQMEENMVSLDPEINEKLHRISELMKELFSEELKEAYKKLEEAIRTGNREEIEKRLKELIQKKEVWKENLERTLSLLERIKKEYDLKKLVEQAKKVEKDILETSKNPEKGKIEKTSQELENLLKEMEKLKEGYEKDIKEKIEEAQKEGMKALKEMENRNLNQSFKSASKMRENLETAMQNFLKKNMQFSMKLLEKAFWGVMGFIKEIKNLNEDIYLAYKNFLEETKLSARNTLMFPRDAFREMANAKFFMEEYLLATKNNERSQSELYFKEIKASLSRAGYYLLQFSEQVASSGGSESQFMKNLMKKLSEMIKNQSNINQMTFSLMPLPSPQQLSPQEKALLEELTKEQGKLLKELSELLKELEKRGEKSGIKGALEGAKKDMEEAEKELRKKELTERLKNLQERILSRLLQAQRSVRKREFVKRRYAERPKPYNIEKPENIDFSEYYRIMKGKRKLFENKDIMPYERETILKYYDYLERYENK